MLVEVAKEVCRNRDLPFLILSAYPTGTRIIFYDNNHAIGVEKDFNYYIKTYFSKTKLMAYLPLFQYKITYKKSRNY